MFAGKSGLYAGNKVEECAKQREAGPPEPASLSQSTFGMQRFAINCFWQADE
jgi:hypothetical protein